MKSKRIKIALVIISTILFSLFGTTGVYGFVYRDRILPGVKIESLDVGGLTVDAATRRVEKTFKPQGDLKLVYKDIKQTVDLNDIGAKVRAKRSAAKAFAVGRNRGLFENSRQRYYALTSGFRIQVTWTSDTKKTRVALKRAAKIIEQPPIDAKLLIDQKNVSIEP
ncbi:MAG: peptidoglycan binding domain-containing protein, partial [Actinomycetia bacterium]|nr:peptidoglycan binding domain-containing protein [Actinomycetes bacterium]